MTPCGSTKDDLDLLTKDLSWCCDKLRLKTKVSKVLLNLIGEGNRDAVLHEYQPRGLLETTLDTVVTRQPDVFRGARTFERNYNCSNFFLVNISSRIRF